MINNTVPKHILLVDDDPDDIFLHQLVIQESGIATKIAIAENGEVAWQYFSCLENPDFKKPDIIFLDINMPRIDGFEFLELYVTLSEGFRRDIKVVVLSTSSNPFDVQRANAILPDIHFSTKPLLKETLLRLLDEKSSLSNA